MADLIQFLGIILAHALFGMLILLGGCAEVAPLPQKRVDWPIADYPTTPSSVGQIYDHSHR